ncbi:MULTISPECIES: SRPBCC family protein [unclassified Streptomyces]|uniref:SRPBCC family protein n=1 Tax=unclassified Streptomyces TaxID=2593676 RepID=UPI002E14E0F1|nr:SRPBCC family protein [Streptomyces sp. NBC_01197]WSS52857.1 SRPBCC family protein [Streptomyces sp. NBC_01180]
MILTNEIAVRAAPDAVFKLLNEVERVAACMPGAALDGLDGDAWRGRVKVKVGPITAGYAGTVRFLESDPAARRLRLQASGADVHGSGDAEAAVDLEVAEAPDGSGSLLRISTDLVIRGKIAQFGKGAIVTVSDRLLRQFAQNLVGQLSGDSPVIATGSTTTVAAGSPAPAAAPAATAPELDGLALLVGPTATRYVPVVAAFAAGMFQGWLMTRAFARR